jgi:DNA-3-methyladenine glycosylase II
LRGVGRWTAEYVLLRGCGRLHVFPGDDVGAQKRLARWLGRPRPLDYAGVGRAVSRWQPYAGLVYFHLLLAGLSDSGALDSITDLR